MKVLSWNINGIRAVTGKTGVKKMLKSLDADVVCLQETKVTRDMLDEPTAIVEGYESYFSFSRKRTGYSGTANYCSKQCTPVCAEEGLTGRLQVDEETSVGCYGNTDAYSEKDLEALDAEGRCVITQHKVRLKDGMEKDVAIINVYVPRAGDRPERLEYKLKFLTVLQGRAQALLRENVHVIILGDLNLTHTAKDNCDPKSDADFLRHSSRVWINNLLRPSERDPNIAQTHPDLEAVSLSENAQEVAPVDGESDETVENIQAKETMKNKSGNVKRNDGNQQFEEALLFSDVYRYLHPHETTGYTNWDTSTDARKSNYGRRLDYILIDTGFASHVTDCCILADVEGSDHCPVMVTLDCQPLPCPTSSTPQLCSKLMPEFRGQQQKLSSFFTKTSVSKKPDTESPSPSEGSQTSSQESNDVIIVESVQSEKLTKVPISVKASSVKPNLKRGKSSVSSVLTSGTLPLKKTKQTGATQSSLMSFFAPKTNSSTKEHSKSVASSYSNVKSKSNLVFTNSIPKRDEHVLCVENQDSVVDSSNQKEGSPILSSDDKDKNISSTDDSGESKLSAKRSQSTGTPQEKKPALTSSESWKSLLCGPAPPPLCPGHKEPCILRTVRKNGPNKNKQFYCCPRPEGPPGNPQFRCSFFQWLHDRQKKKT